ncbi:MAG: hypothetical protein AAF720_00170 [Pseudomonadota bacterium]
MRHRKKTRPCFVDAQVDGQSDFSKQLNGYRLATAEILYRMPDHHEILQSYIWQDYDLAPEYPILTKFLDFWTHNLDGPLHSVRIAGKEIISPSAVNTGAMFHIH